MVVPRRPTLGIVAAARNATSSSRRADDTDRAVVRSTLSGKEPSDVALELPPNVAAPWNAPAWRRAVKALAGAPRTGKPGVRPDL
jgi:hypothetical protein